MQEMNLCLLTVTLLIMVSSFLPFHYASGQNPQIQIDIPETGQNPDDAMKSQSAEEGPLESKCSACIAFVNKVFDSKRNSKEMQESDLKIARSVLCPKNPDFPICQRNEVSVWEDAFMTPEMALAFCTSLPNNDCNKDK